MKKISIAVLTLSLSAFLSATANAWCIENESASLCCHKTWGEWCTGVNKLEGKAMICYPDGNHMICASN